MLGRRKFLVTSFLHTLQTLTKTYFYNKCICIISFSTTETSSEVTTLLNY